MNLKAIADAIAGRYAGITATNGSATEGLQSTPTASLPNAVTKGPVILVFPPTGETQIGTSAIRQGEVTYLVRMLRDPINMPDRTDWLYAWDNAMRDRVEGNLDLDLPAYVAEAEVTSFRLEIDGEDYGLAFFDVVEHTVTVTIYEQNVPVGV
jgi:hypothetical protein